MKNFLFALCFLAGAQSVCLAQNRLMFKHRLSQSMINGARFQLLDGTGATITIADASVVKCNIKLDGKGKILVDFWQFTGNDPNAGHATILNSQMVFSLDNPITLTDSRRLIGDPTRVLYVPFSGVAFGVTTLPFKLRGSQNISDTEKVNTTVTSPRPDLAFTGGWTFGYSSITSRAIINYSATISGFVGLNGAEIKNGVVKADSDLYGTSRTQTNVALSYGTSVTFARNNIGVIVAFGFDNSFGQYSDDWIYQNKPYLGIGVSANLGIF